MSTKSHSSELFNRYVWLANTVFSAGRITFEEISAKWRRSYLNNSGNELPLRTFHEHRHAVEELFGIDICCDRSDGFRYYVENAEDIEAGNLNKWILGSMSVSTALAESRAMRERILLEDIPSGLNFLTPIIDAMRDGHLVEISHRGFGKDNDTLVRIEPYCTKLSHQRWYVLGRNIQTNEMRVYGLDRISGCRLLADRFTMPKDFDAEAFFNDYFGVYVDPSVDLEAVRVKVTGVQREYLRSLPLHHSQREISCEGDSSVFEYVIRPTVDFINALVQISADASVESPQWLREEVGKRIGRMAAIQKVQNEETNSNDDTGTENRA